MPLRTGGANSRVTKHHCIMTATQGIARTRPLREGEGKLEESVLNPKLSSFSPLHFSFFLHWRRVSGSAVSLSYSLSQLSFRLMAYLFLQSERGEKGQTYVEARVHRSRWIASNRPSLGAQSRSCSQVEWSERERGRAIGPTVPSPFCRWHNLICLSSSSDPRTTR